METIRIVHAAGLLGIKTAAIIQTALVAVPHVATDNLPARIKTGARSCRMFSVQRANG